MVLPPTTTIINPLLGVGGRLTWQPAIPGVSDVSPWHQCGNQPDDQTFTFRCPLRHPVENRNTSIYMTRIWEHIYLYDQKLSVLKDLSWFLALNFWRSRYPWNLEVCLNFAVIIFSIYKKKNSKLIRKPIQFKSTADNRNVLHSNRKLNRPITSITSRIHASSPIWSG